MTNYIVTYDLNKAGQDYSGLINAIERYPHVKGLKSAWFIKSNLYATDIYNDLRRYIDGNDLIFIGGVTTNYEGLMPTNVWDFLKS